MYNEEETLDADIYLDYNTLGKLLTNKSIQKGQISLTQDVTVSSVEIEEQSKLILIKCLIKQNYLN